VDELDELRALVREVIRDVLPQGLPLGLPLGLPVTETVNLSTDEDLAAFVAGLLELDPEEREEIRSGRKRFRLAAPEQPANGTARAPATAGHPARRVGRGAVTEQVIRDAARAGERLVLGPGAVLTPLARDRARASGVEISRER
jgi:hypothetical protein